MSGLGLAELCHNIRTTLLQQQNKNIVFAAQLNCSGKTIFRNFCKNVLLVEKLLSLAKKRHGEA